MSSEDESNKYMSMKLLLSIIEEDKWTMERHFDSLMKLLLNVDNNDQWNIKVLVLSMLI